MNTKTLSVLCDVIRRFTNTPLTIHICGEDGVGKEAVARFLFRYYPSKNGTFIKIDGRRLDTEADNSQTCTQWRNIEAEPQNKVIYLEYIDAISQRFQDSLLALLNTASGANPPWIISAGRSPLERENRSKRFTPQLFKALGTVQISLPPVRSKSDKIPKMLSWFLNFFNSESPTKTLPMPGRQVMDDLICYEWPRNWRQLHAVVRRAFDRQSWNLSIRSQQFIHRENEELDSVSAIHILSMGQLGIQEDKVIDALVAASDPDHLGLMDLAVFSEAVRQMAECISRDDE